MTNTETPETSPSVAAVQTAPKKRPTTAAKAGAKRKPGKKLTESRSPRSGTKGAKVLEMIGRTKGATLAELTKATRWQLHSIRGFLSTAPNKYGVRIDSIKNETGQRTYRLAR